MGFAYWESWEFLSWQTGLQRAEPVAMGNFVQLALDVWRLCGHVWKTLSFGWRFITVTLPTAGHVVVIQEPTSCNSTGCEFSEFFENWQMHLPCLWGSLSLGLYKIFEVKMIW